MAFVSMAQMAGRLRKGQSQVIHHLLGGSGSKRPWLTTRLQGRSAYQGLGLWFDTRSHVCLPNVGPMLGIYL